MAGVRVTHHLDDLEADLRYIARTARGDMRNTVRDGIRAGNMLAKDSAKVHNPPHSHAHQYPGKFSAEMHTGAFGGGSLFGNVISGEYGPTHEGQGELAGILENGSRKGNAAQLNLARSTDVIGPAFAQEVRALPDRWFWPSR